MLMKRTKVLSWTLATPPSDDSRVIINGPGIYQRAGDQLIISNCMVPSILPLTTNSVLVDASQVTFPCEWRLSQPEERFVPLGNPGSQTVIKHLANRAVPSPKRAHIAVLADRHGLVWIPGFTMAHRVRVSKHSEQALQLQWTPSCD
jgi:hypothetical protein